MTLNVPITVPLALAAIAILYSALLTLQVFEFRRFTRSRTRHAERGGAGGTVALIVPCSGLEPGLQQNLRALFEQDHEDYQLWFVLETLHDPAGSVVLKLMRQYPQRPARLIVAGTTRHSGQKVHNLLAATADLPDELRYLAFVDSDVRPRRDWLRQLVQHLDQPGVAAATAYRWLVPVRGSLCNWLAHSLDASVAALMGPGRHHLVWGGSWAIRREVFEFSGLRQAWHGTLSDDLVAARVLRRLGRVEFEPGAVTLGEIDFDRRSLCAFVRRQFAIGRLHAPWLWAAASVFGVLQQAVCWAGAGLGLIGLACGGQVGLPLGVSLLLYGLQVARAWLRQDAARCFGRLGRTELSAPSRFDISCAPLAGLLGCWGLLAGIGSDRILWRGFEYRVAPGGRIRALRTPDRGARPKNKRLASRGRRVAGRRRSLSRRSG